MGTFVDAMDTSAVPTHAFGENGSLELTADGVGEARAALFAALARGAENVPELTEAVVREARGDAACLADLVVLAFQTRDCRGGKGEKALFATLLWELLARYPETTLKLLPLIPEYGSWRDLNVLWEAVDGAPPAKPKKETKGRRGAADAAPAKPPAAARARAAEFREAVEALLEGRLRKDLAALEGAAAAGAAKPSLAGKYAPREGKQFSKLGSALAKRLFPGPEAKKNYRQALSKLSAALDVPETKMCGKRWADIEVTAVPSRCLAKSRKAFLNEKVKRTGQMSKQQDVTGDRFPDDPDRVACRANLREAVVAKAGALKGKQLFPHEIVRSTMKNYSGSTLEDDVADAQWGAIMKDLTEQLHACGGGNLGKLVPLSDVSGSMSGVPMEVAIALGIVVSDLAAEPFKHRVMTFESTPRWHRLAPTLSPTEKIRNLQRAPWGGSTNFAKALDLILAACVENGVKPEDMPEMIVFSDMQFDQADDAWETHHGRLVRTFKAKGYELPTITYWNLRGDTGGGFMASAKTPGVRLLSGFSPALLKLVLTGEEEEEVVVVNKDGTTSKVKPTPYSTMRKALDAARYDAVREVLAAETAGAFADYSFVAAEAATVVGGEFEMVDAA